MMQEEVKSTASENINPKVTSPEPRSKNATITTPYAEVFFSLFNADVMRHALDQTARRVANIEAQKGGPRPRSVHALMMTVAVPVNVGMTLLLLHDCGRCGGDGFDDLLHSDVPDFAV